MSRVDDLIKELCPNGVEFKKLKNLGVRNKGIGITAAKMRELDIGRGIRVFAGGATIAHIEETSLDASKIIKEPSIIVKSRGHIGFDYCDVPFTHKSELWSYTLNSPLIDQKFVYHLLNSQKSYFQSLAEGTSVKIPQLSIRDTDEHEIPVPPLEIQQEIARILDKFTQLEAELEARRKQYAYYREQLLTFPETGGNRLNLQTCVAGFQQAPRQKLDLESTTKTVLFRGLELLKFLSIRFIQQRRLLPRPH